MGFIQNFDLNGKLEEVTNDYVLSNDYEIDVAGIKFPAKCLLSSLDLLTKFSDKKRDSSLMPLEIPVIKKKLKLLIVIVLCKYVQHI